jgi:hypothetical protein
MILYNKDYSGKTVKLNERTLKIELENYFAMIKEGYEIDGKNIKSTIFASKRDAIALRNNLDCYPQLITLKRATKIRYRRNKKIFKEMKNNYIRVNFGDECFKSIDLFKEHFFRFISYNHIAFIDTKYYIEKNFDKQKCLWTKLCSNGLFNQWEWSAPFASYLEERSPVGVQEILKSIIREEYVDKSQEELLMNYFNPEPIILLLRIYEINIPFDYNNLYTYIDRTGNRTGHSLYFDTIANKDYHNYCITTIKEPIISDEDFFMIRYKLENIMQECNIEYKPKYMEYKSCWCD